MKLLDKKTAGDAVRLSIFIVVTVLATALLAVLIGNIDFHKTNTYSAVFSDATGVNKGDDVRVSGVRVGTVKSIDIVPDADDATKTDAEVVFTVRQGTMLTQATDATIKYRNLIGQRYIALTQGIGDSSELTPDSQIPPTHTSPALDLTVLFNGFKPLFQALSPDDVNKLSFEIVQVFQGEGGTLEDLLSSTATITNTLADRDKVIGQLIDNLNYVLNHIADRDQQLSRLIINFKDLVVGLKNDRGAILGSLNGISRLAEQTASLVKGVRPPFVEDVKQLRRLATILDRPRNKAEINRALQVLPIKLNKVGRTAAYGSFFNFYLCATSGTITLPVVGAQKVSLPDTNAKRCSLG